MIGYLEGEALRLDEQSVIIKCNNGIGYEVKTSANINEAEKNALYIAHVIRENAQELYGFLTLEEKKMFNLLNKVKGVGPKSSFVLISSLGVGQIVNAITLEDKKLLSKAPGIGPKAAAQIILDLSSKVGELSSFSSSSTLSSKTESVLPAGDSSLIQDTIMACKELGFDESMVMEKVKDLVVNHNIKKPEELIHLVLKEM